MEQIRKQSIELFLDAQRNQSQFKRKIYEDAFLAYYERHKELLAHMIELCERAEDKESVIDEIASVIPEYAHGQMNKLPGKRKQENRNMDYNLSMVTFVIPFMNYTHNDYCTRIVDKLVEKWNQAPVTMKLQKSTFEDMKGGFRSRLCYITTAVCESQNKGDDCYELQVLRDFRDRHLLASERGRQMVEQYYDVAPTIVTRIDKMENSNEIYRNIYDTYLSPCIHLLEEEQLETCGEVYASMVEELKKEYLYS